jgi:hypothetical protein
MNGTLADLKSAYDFAKMKYEKALHETPYYGSEQTEYWSNKMRELEERIEESVRLLEG